MTANPDTNSTPVLTKEAWKLLLKNQDPVRLTLQFLKLTEPKDDDAIAEFSDGSYAYQMQVQQDSSACNLLGIVKVGALLDVWAVYCPETNELEGCIALDKIVPIKNQTMQLEISSHLQSVPKNLELLEDSSESVDSREWLNLVEQELGDVELESEPLQARDKNTSLQENQGMSVLGTKPAPKEMNTRDLQALGDGKFNMVISLRLEKVFQKMTRNSQGFFSSCIAFDEYYKVQLIVFHDSWIDFHKDKVYKFEGCLQYDRTPNKYSSFSDVSKLTVSCNTASVAAVEDTQTAIPLFLSTYEKDFRHNQQRADNLVDGGILDFKGKLWECSEPDRFKVTKNMHENYRMTLRFYGTSTSIMLRGSFEELQEMRQGLESENEYVVENLKYRKPKHEGYSNYAESIRLFGGKHVLIRPTGNSSKARAAKLLTQIEEPAPQISQNHVDHSSWALGKRDLSQPKTTDELLSNLTGGKPGIWKKPPSPGLAAPDHVGNPTKAPVVVSIDE